MAATRTPGITISGDGRRFIDKRYRGVRIGMRLGAMTQEQVEQRLSAEMQRVDINLARTEHWHARFADCAARYLYQCRAKSSLEAIQVHVRLLLPHIGHLEPHQVHDATLASFIAERLSAGASATTINRSLEGGVFGRPFQSILLCRVQVCKGQSPKSPPRDDVC